MRKLLLLLALTAFLVAPAFGAECDGTVAIWWTLNDTANDTCTPFYNGTNTGGAYVNAMFANGTDLEAGDAQDRIEIPDGAYEVATNRTVAIWARPESIGATMIIANKRAVAGDQLDNFMIQQRAANVFWCIAGDGIAWDTAISVTNSIVGTWYHIACMYDVTNQNISIWINGTMEHNVTGSANQSNNADILIGCYGDGLVCDAVPLWYDGITDEFIYINRTLNGTEINNLVNYNNITGIIGGGGGSNGCDITLYSHDNNTNNGYWTTNTSSVNFSFTPTCYDVPTHCDIVLSNSSRIGANASDIVNGSVTTITANQSLAVGTLDWRVNCTNGTISNNSDTSWLLNAYSNPAWDALNYGYRKPVVVYNMGESAKSFYHVKFVFNASNFDFSRTQLDGDDIRFYNNTVAYDYFVDEWDNSSEWAIAWANITGIPANNSALVFVYYGYAVASSGSNGTNTFAWFDHFDLGVGVDPLMEEFDGWGVGVTVNVSNSWATINSTSDAASGGAYQSATRVMTVNHTLRAKMKYWVQSTGNNKNLCQSRWNGNVPGNDSDDACNVSCIYLNGSDAATWWAGTGGGGGVADYTLTPYGHPLSFEWSWQEVQWMSHFAGYLIENSTSSATLNVTADVPPWPDYYIKLHDCAEGTNMSADYMYLRTFDFPEPEALLGGEEARAPGGPPCGNASFSDWKAIYLWADENKTLQNHQVLFKIDYEAAMQTDFDDVRFCDNDNATTLDYWILNYTTGSEMLVWVEVNDSITTLNTTLVWMIYGNATVNNASNGNTTFEFFDNAETGAMTARWNNISCSKMWYNGTDSDNREYSLWCNGTGAAVRRYNMTFPAMTSDWVLHYALKQPAAYGAGGYYYVAATNTTNDIANANTLYSLFGFLDTAPNNWTAQAGVPGGPTANYSQFSQSAGWHSFDMHYNSTSNIFTYMVDNQSSTAWIINKTMNQFIQLTVRGFNANGGDTDGYYADTVFIRKYFEPTVHYSLGIPTYLRVNTWNEQNNTQALVFNITVYNNTASVTASNQTEYYHAGIGGGFPTGNISLVISKTGWTTRTFYTTYLEGYQVNLNAYLLQSGQGVWATFYVIDTDWNPIVNATLNFYRQYGAAWVQVIQAQTDSFGSTQEYLDPYTTYEYRAFATGYGIRIGTLNPIATDYYIVLGTEAALNYTNSSNFFFAYVRPTSSLVNISTDNITFRINDPLNNLNWFSLNLTNGTGSYSFTNVSGSPSGGTIMVNLSGLGIPANYSFPFQAIAQYSRNSSSIHEFFRDYFPVLLSTQYPPGYWRSFLTVREELASTAPGAVAVIALMILVLFAGVISKQIGFGGGLIFLVIGAVLAWTGWIPWVIYVLAAGLTILLLLSVGRRV